MSLSDAGRRARQDAPPAPAPSSSTALSGYMDLQYRKAEFQDGELDFRRFVLLVTHRFSDRIRFVSELELEHAFVEGLEESGELELEQAYSTSCCRARSTCGRASLLIPVGIINERHEPPVYYGVDRPMVDTFLVPTTWFEAGAGVHGEVGRGWRYRAYVVSPLNAALFSAEEGLRDGRQKGSRTNAGRAAATGRLEYVGAARPDRGRQLLDRAIPASSSVRSSTCRCGCSRPMRATRAAALSCAPSSWMCPSRTPTS